VEEGFDRNEAKHLAYLIRSQYTGKFGGLIVGSVIALTWRGWYGRMAEYIPRLKIKQQQYRLLAQASIILVRKCFILGINVHRRFPLHWTPTGW
jgi:hypothetical protein